jgi:hypothetical protein
MLPTFLKQKIVERLQRSYLTFNLHPLSEAPLTLLERLLYEQHVDDIPIQQPIFIVGCHRSGTTVLYEALAKHPDLVYFTNASNLLPTLPILSNILCSSLGLDDVVQERFLQDGITITPFTPNEGIRIWERYAFEQVDYCLSETYDNPQMEAYLRLTIQKHLKHFHGKRFINKNPDNSVRIRYLNKLFPDAYFINIIRDGRAVCSSLLKARDLAENFFGPEHRHSTSGIKTSDWHKIKQVWDNNPVAGSGMLWRAVMETIEQDRAAIAKARYMELRYEDFVVQPLEYLRQIVNFCQLPWNASVESLLGKDSCKITLDERNNAWKKRLSSNDLNCLMNVIGTTMMQYGYEV